MLPARELVEVRIRPPSKGRLVAVAPQYRVCGSSRGRVETRVMRPPHDRVPAVGLSSSARQNSHIVSVEGCQTTRWPSVPAAGCALSGIGTDWNAALRSSWTLSRITLTLGWSAPTL